MENIDMKVTNMKNYAIDYSTVSNIMKTFVVNTIAELVDYPEKITVKISISTKNIIIQIDVEKTDRGKVIGKNGRTIDALKTICLAIKNTKFKNDSRKIIIEVLEDEMNIY
jgi:predicted RNA-binding protein YlqC (UPF0109 family)